MRLPITEKIADEELSLPIGPAITLEEVKQVVELINQFTLMIIGASYEQLPMTFVIQAVFGV